MIIKTISRKSNVDQLIKYVLRDDKVKLDLTVRPDNRKYIAGMLISPEAQRHLLAEAVDGKLWAAYKECGRDIDKFMERYINVDPLDAIVIKNNIRARTINGYIKAFQENEALRVHKRSNNVQAYHTIISFSGNDRDAITEKMLRDISRQYISLKGENSLYVGAVHQEKEHIHIHLIQSGTQYCTGVANRISRQEFQELKVSMQAYQVTKYPELVHSSPDFKGQTIKTKHMDSKKNKKPNERESSAKELVDLLTETFKNAKSTKQVLEQIVEQGHQPYYRNGNLQGILYEGERKYRFSSLGFKDQLKELESKTVKQSKELKELEQLRGPRKSRTIENRKQEQTEKNAIPEKSGKNVKEATASQNLNREPGQNTIAVNPSSKQYAGDIVTATLNPDKLCDDCKKEQEDPNYNNPKYYVNGVFDYNKYTDHALEEIGNATEVQYEPVQDNSNNSSNDRDTTQNDRGDTAGAEAEIDEPDDGRTITDTTTDRGRDDDDGMDR